MIINLWLLTLALTLTHWVHYLLMSHDLMLSCIIRIKKRVIATALTIQNVLNLPSQLTFAGYRFSDKNFVTMNEYINDTNHYTNYQNEKESYIVTFNQYLESLRLNTYVSLARNTYWDASSNVNYSLSLSRDFDIGPLKNVSTSLTFSRINWEEDNQINCT